MRLICREKTALTDFPVRNDRDFFMCINKIIDRDLKKWYNANGCNASITIQENAAASSAVQSAYSVVVHP